MRSFTLVIACILLNRGLVFSDENSSYNEETRPLRAGSFKSECWAEYERPNIQSQVLSPGCSLSFFYEIAKQNCHDISSIRVEIDRINNEILNLLSERTAYVKRAGDLKSQTTKIADDRQRVADQERKIIDKSIELELPIEISVPAFRAIVEQSIIFQQGYINQK